MQIWVLSSYTLKNWDYWLKILLTLLEAYLKYVLSFYSQYILLKVPRFIILSNMVYSNIKHIYKANNTKVEIFSFCLPELYLFLIFQSSTLWCCLIPLRKGGRGILTAFTIELWDLKLLSFFISYLCGLSWPWQLSSTLLKYYSNNSVPLCLILQQHPAVLCCEYGGNSGLFTLMTR